MLIELLCLALLAYYFILIARVIVSFAQAFGWRPPSQLMPVVDVLYNLTEPILAFLRRYIPPVGGLDFSPFVIFIVLGIARGSLC